MGDIDAIFKSYDIRGLYPQEIDSEACGNIGHAFYHFLDQEGEWGSNQRILVGYDMRPSGEELATAFIQEFVAKGIEVVSLGLCSTDMLYFASGHYSAPGVVFTASHNPVEYNGLKLCKSKAVPIGEGSGLERIKILAKDLETEKSDGKRLLGEKIRHSPLGELRKVNVLEDFVSHALGFIAIENLKEFQVVADTANGMGGLIAPAVFEKIPPNLQLLYGELDGTFPNHPADPLNPENLVDLKKEVLDKSADIGLAFDGDADRVFLIDELGMPLSGSTTTAIVAEGVLAKEPKASIIYNLICSRIVKETVIAKGGNPIRSRVGHSHIKKLMADTNSAFGGEHSGHYYFRDNFYADSGIIAALIVLEQMSLQQVPLSQLRKNYEIYFSTGELNFEIHNTGALLDTLANEFNDQDQDTLDGLTVSSKDWWFNLRLSNTEPLIRLNLEAKSEIIRNEKLKFLKEIISDFRSSDAK
ncbi:MAG: phosphomannomutase/phosphoglucomutase [Acidimicrobiales bacterium]|nr:phosphomannomutase/phosphoglucomutase [Acidimicrobiales bacterium]|tara:strand:+ start:57085 stop:58500 length:1416 start_codon:yes stop_codon:yes gene_type:complete